MEETYKISEISRITEIPIPTLRYYEELGLLKPKRGLNNYRIFTDQDLRWIEFIKRAKATGMPLLKIIQYSKLREQGDTTIGERIEILQQQEQILYAQKDEIQKHIDFLQNKKHYYRQALATADKK